jgi:hypothetical protein
VKTGFHQVRRTEPSGQVNLLKCMVRRLTAREKLVDEESLRQCIRPVVWRCLLAMMRYAASLSFETPRPCQGHLSKQASGAPF